MGSVVKIGGNVKLSAIKDLEQDEEGYYLVDLGSYNDFNVSGDFYSGEGIEDLITNPKSKLYQTINSGLLTGEADHPTYPAGTSRRDMIMRNCTVSKSRECVHFKQIIVTHTDIPSPLPGYGNIIKISGWLKPSGQLAKSLETALANKRQNIAFSVRSLVKDTVVNGITIKTTLQITTWDYVNIPGKPLATAWKTVGNESIKLDKELLKEVLEQEKVEGLATEEESIVPELTRIIETTSTPSIIERWGSE